MLRQSSADRKAFGRLLRLACLVAVALSLAGCGGSSSGAVSNGGATAQVATASVRGRLKLDVPIAGASVTALDSTSGRALSSPAITDSGGFFKVEVPLTGAFTLRATVDAQGRAEVYERCYDEVPQSRFLHVNALTTIIARYRQLHPSLSAQVAEARVKQSLGVPLSIDAGLGAHAHALSNFAHSLFVRQARAYPGGETAYVAALAGGIDASRAKGVANGAAPSPGGVSLTDAAAKVSRWLDELEKEERSGLFGDNAVNQFALSASSFTDTSSIVSSSAASNAATVGSAAANAGAEAAEHVEGGVISSLLHGLASDVASAVVGVAIEALFSAIFPSNPNQDVLNALQSISGQIQDLQNSVSQLSAFIATAFQQTQYQTNAETLRSAFTTIDTSWLGPVGNGSGYASALSQAAGGTANGLSASLTSLAQILPGGFNYQDIPTLAAAQSLIASGQLGTTPGVPSLMRQFRDLVSPSANGGGGYRYAANFSINQMYGQWSQLASYQMKSAQVIACLYRAGTGNGPDFASAAATLKSTTDQIQQQRTQLPFPMPDDKIIYDTASGLVLYGELFPSVPIGDNLNFAGGVGGWPYYLTAYNSGLLLNLDPYFPWSGVAPLAFGAGDLNRNTWTLPTAGMLWTFLDPNRATYSGADYSAQPNAPAVPYLHVLQRYGFTLDSPSSWTFQSINLLYNWYDYLAATYWVNGYDSVHGPESLPFSNVITTGYNSPWNTLSLIDGTVLPNIDAYHSSFGSTYRGQTETYSEQTADNQSVAPYVLMAVATPSDGQPHADVSLFPNLEPLSTLANVPVGLNGLSGGLHCATNRAFFGCGRQQAASVAFSGTQLVALAAENPQAQPGVQGLFGLTGSPAANLSDFITQHYGWLSPGAYVEGPNGIDNDIDGHLAEVTGEPLINSCWDLTPYLYWTSSNPQIADVSNAPGRIGQIIRRGNAPGGLVTFTGTRLELNRAGSVGNTVTVTCQATFAAMPAAALTTLFITPRYQTVHVNSPQPQTRVFAVGQYADGTSQAVPNGVTWSSSDPAVSVGPDGSVSVTGAPAQQSVTITAQQGVITGTVELTVLNP